MKFWAILICSTLLCGGLPVLLGACTTSSSEPTTDESVHATIQTISNPTSTPNVTMKQYDTVPKITVNSDSLYVATIEMKKGGKIVIDLFQKEAPVTVNNFISLSRDGYYDGVTFHRVIPGFMAQSGDPTGSGTGGPGYTIPDEFSPLRRHDGPGVLSMANTGRPNSGGGQWFITFVATPHLDDAHTVFGKVTSGMDVVQKITVRDPSNATTKGDVIKTITIQEINKSEISYNPDNTSNSDQYQQVIEEYSKAIEEDLANPIVYYNRGTVYAKIGRYDKAIKDLDKALELDPNYAFAYYNRGMAYANLAQYEETIKDLDKALELDSSNAFAYYNRGLAYAKLNRYQEAVKDFDKTLEQNPEDTSAYYVRGITHASLTQYEKAINDLDKVIETDPTNAGAYFNRGTSYANLGRYQEALNDLDKVIELIPNNPFVYNLRGKVYNDLGQQDLAQNDLDRACQLDNDFC